MVQGMQMAHIVQSYMLYSIIITLIKLKRTGDPFSLKPQRKMSPCPIKKGHFETHHVTLCRAINTVSFSVVKEDF